jgi:type IV pilus assembly protein PilF
MMRLLPYSLIVSLCTSLVLVGCASRGGTSPNPVVQDTSNDVITTQNTPETLRKSATAHTNLGLAYLEIDRMNVALDEARTALKADPGYSRAHYLLAMVYFHQEQNDKAWPEFREAIRLAPDDAEINNSYGYFLCTQGQEREGLQRLEEVARNPYNEAPTGAWTNAGLCLLRLNDDGGAEERFVRALQADEGNFRAQQKLAEIAYRTKRFMRAKQFIDKVQQKVRTPGPDVYWLAARIERKLGNMDTVGFYGSKLRKEFPESNEYQLFTQGKFE